MNNNSMSAARHWPCAKRNSRPLPPHSPRIAATWDAQLICCTPTGCRGPSRCAVNWNSRQFPPIPRSAARTSFAASATCRHLKTAAPRPQSVRPPFRSGRLPRMLCRPWNRRTARRNRSTTTWPGCWRASEATRRPTGSAANLPRPRSNRRQQFAPARASRFRG